MNKIEVKILNPDSVFDSEKMMVCAARLTQRGHQIKSMEDFLKLYEKSYGEDLVESLVSLPEAFPNLLQDLLACNLYTPFYPRQNLLSSVML